ncbi:GGDEF domain-containing protein [Lacticaseibacillus kribbianus]|uniref:GGDEF domain-containing protein n=1 Tax=Lacticaseibacillus kribbianus TaxID=2926292 RepID=UPI001CD59C77|nr:GGDEF domain-containing protein [Lacticaseibacillus kribbianus]
MELFENTFFWFFFFMIGLAATLELIDGVGPQLVRRFLHRRVESAWLIVGYALIILVFVRMLRVNGTTYSWTANALRNGTLMFVAPRIRNRHALWVFMAATFLSFWPFWDWNPLALAGFTVTVLLLVPLQHYGEGLHSRPWRLAAVSAAVSTVYWVFDAYAYGYTAAQTVILLVCYCIVMAVADGYGRLLIYREEQKQSLVYDTQHDALTGVLSRAKFASDIARWRRLRVRGQVPPVHLAMLDLDHFKQINDALGHLAGDAVLREFADTCQGFLEQAEYPCAFYRTGGEEFSLIIAGGAGDEAATALVEALVANCRQNPVTVDGHSLTLTVSAGMTSIFKADVAPDDVIGRADTNLYAAKRGGRDTTVADVAGDR